MQFEIGQAEFSAVLEKMVKTVETKTTIPVLANIKIKAVGEELEFEATDLENALRISVPAKIKKEGVMLVPAKKAHEIVKRLPAGQVKVKLAENHWAHVESGKAKFKLCGMSPEHFPAWTGATKEPIQIDGEALQKAIRMVEYAVSTETSRYTLSAILIENGKVVATDGHRMAIYSHKAFAKVKSALIPLRGIQIAVGLMDGEGTVAMAETESAFVFSAKNWTISMRKLSGKFPNYEAVIPKKEAQTVSAKFVAAPFVQCMERVGLSSDSRTGCMRFTFSKDGVEFYAANPESGEATDSLEATCSGELKIGFNFRYITDFLKRVEGEVTMLARDEQSGALFEYQDFVYVAMPMRY